MRYFSGEIMNVAVAASIFIHRKFMRRRFMRSSQCVSVEFIKLQKWQADSSERIIATPGDIYWRNIMVDKRRYYPLITAAVTSVLIFFMVGIGILMGWLPMPRSMTTSHLGRVITGSEDVSRIAVTECSNCGAIESIKTIALQYHPPVFGSVMRGAGEGVYLVDEKDKHSRRRTFFRVVVRMDDGSQRILHGLKQQFFVGERIKIIRDEIFQISDN